MEKKFDRAKKKIVCAFTNRKSHAHTVRPEITTIQIFVPCGDRTRDTQRSSRSLSHCASRAVILAHHLREHFTIKCLTARMCKIKLGIR